jgi:hypothetical protein
LNTQNMNSNQYYDHVFPEDLLLNPHKDF